MDSLGIKDSSSSKNLCVLWSRAYLNHFGKRVNSIAYQLLPERTRDVIKLLPMMGPLVDFQEFITSWTVFIDGAVNSFLHGDDEIETTTTQSRRLYCLVLGTTHAIFATTAVRPSSRLICPTPSRARGDCSGIGRRIWTTSAIPTGHTPHRTHHGIRWGHPNSCRAAVLSSRALSLGTCPEVLNLLFLRNRY